MQSDSGIHLSRSVNNNADANILSDNDMGIKLEGYGYWSLNGSFVLEKSFGNSFTKNEVANNTVGIYMGGSDSNAFTLNNIEDNSEQIRIENYTVGSRVDISSITYGNMWDNGVEGNYWSDYLDSHPQQPPSSTETVYSEPYVIDAENQDNYPLMQPQKISPPTSQTDVLVLFLVPVAAAALLGLAAFAIQSKKNKQ
jgi:parallel beta-helix repeat protein